MYNETLSFYDCNQCPPSRPHPCPCHKPCAPSPMPCFHEHYCEPTGCEKENLYTTHTPKCPSPCCPSGMPSPCVPACNHGINWMSYCNQKVMIQMGCARYQVIVLSACDRFLVTLACCTGKKAYFNLEKVDSITPLSC